MFIRDRLSDMETRVWFVSDFIDGIIKIRIFFFGKMKEEETESGVSFLWIVIVI